MTTLPCNPASAGSSSAVAKSASVALPAGDATIVLEWLQVSGTGKLKLMWKTGAVPLWATPRLLAT